MRRIGIGDTDVTIAVEHPFEPGHQPWRIQESWGWALDWLVGVSIERVA
jgi:hypothetical protein